MTVHWVLDVVVAFFAWIGVVLLIARACSWKWHPDGGRPYLGRRPQ